MKKTPPILLIKSLAIQNPTSRLSREFEVGNCQGRGSFSLEMEDQYQDSLDWNCRCVGMLTNSLCTEDHNKYDKYR